jgi:nicotinate-nucleotide adenylyltransferase
MKTIGVFGGSFNPPHIGHVMAAMYALSVGRFDKVLVVPAFQHAFAKNELLVGFEHRLRMAQLAFRTSDAVVITDIERHLSTPSYMVNTLHHLKLGYHLTVQQQEAIFGEAVVPVQFRLILGNECVSEKDKWHKWEEIEEIAPPFILPRKEEQLFPSISSTEIRELIADGLGESLWTQYVPGVVVDYIREHGLYRQKG